MLQTALNLPNFVPQKPKGQWGPGGHKGEMINEEWLTPPEIIQSLGKFDLDPCSPCIRPWDTALNHYCITEDGLQQNWEGRV